MGNAATSSQPSACDETGFPLDLDKTCPERGSDRFLSMLRI